MSDETGLAWWRAPGDVAAVFLVFDRGRVVDCTPYAQPWALDRTMTHIEARAQRLGATVTFTPLSAPPRRFQTHLAETTRLRRWEHPGQRGHPSYLTFGGSEYGWMVQDTREPFAWAFSRRDEAWAETQRRLAVDADLWRRVPANYDARGPLPDVEIAEEG